MTVTKTIVVATHRRSGTHWTLDALRNNSPDINHKFLTLEQTESTHAFPIPLDEFRAELQSLEGRVLIKVHDLPSATYWQNERERQFAQQLMAESPTVYVHRDGRDVMVSLYYYVLSFREDYVGLSFSDFLRMENELDGVTHLSRPAFWAHHIRTWMAQPDLISVSYQSLEHDYDKTIRQIADFVGVTLQPQLQAINIKQPKHKPTFKQRVLRKIGIQPKKVSSAVQPRKGKSGDWRNHFSDDDLDFFMRETDTMMHELGYID